MPSLKIGSTIKDQSCFWTVEEAAKCVAETITENTLVSSAQIVTLSAETFNAELEETLKKHLTAPLKRLDKVKKKYGRLRNALLEEGILDLMSLDDD